MDEDTQEHITLCVDRDLGLVREGWGSTLFTQVCSYWHSLLNQKLVLFFLVVLVSSQRITPKSTVSVC